MCTFTVMMTRVLLDFEASLWSQHVQQFLFTRTSLSLSAGKAHSALWSHSEHRFPAPALLKEVCRKPLFGVCTVVGVRSGHASCRVTITMRPY